MKVAAGAVHLRGARLFIVSLVSENQTRKGDNLWEIGVDRTGVSIDISNMPMLMPIPELVPEPSGDIGFQWSFGEDRVVTVSFEGTNTATYACILGSSKRTKYGKEIFNDRIPQQVVQGVQAIRL